MLNSKKDIPEVKILTEEVNKKFQEISQKLYEQNKSSPTKRRK